MDSLKAFSDMISRYAKTNIFSSKPCYTEAVAERIYVARSDDEFTLYPGDVIRNVAKKQGSWWKGELRGKSGLFQEKYVVFLPQDKEKRRLYGPRRSKEGKPKQFAKVLFNYIPTNEDEFKLEAGDIIEVWDEVEDGWWSGILGDQFGVFPSNYVILLDNKGYNVSDQDDDSDDYCSEKNYDEFDAVKRSSPKLTHLTINRTRGPKRKPPSYKPAPTSLVKKNKVKEKRVQDIVAPKHNNSQQSKAKAIVQQPNVFIELKQKLRDLENEIDDLKEELALFHKNYVTRTEHQKLKIEVDSLREMLGAHRQYCSKLISDLICEVDEEKKLRMVVQIQLDRIMKLLTCTCAKVMEPDISWKDTSV